MARIVRFHQTGGPEVLQIEEERRYGVSIATTRTPEKVEMLRQVGADPVIVTGKEDLAARVMEITRGRGADLIFDGLTSGALWPVIDRIFRPLERIVEAHRYLESNQQNGKIVVTV